MFGNKSVAEWNAETERVKADIAAAKHEQARRNLTREKQKLKLEDAEDRILQLQIQSKEAAVMMAEQRLEQDKILVQSERDKTKYLRAKHQLTLKGYGYDLEIQAIELAGSEEKLRQLKSVAQTLNYKLANNPATQMGLGGAK